MDFGSNMKVAMSRNTTSRQFEGSDSTDEQLLQGVEAGSSDNWTHFVETYSGLIYAWCRQCDLQPADALDVSQQVFFSVHRSIATFDRVGRKGAFRSWLWTVVRNQVRNHLSRTLKGPRPEGGTEIQMRLLEEPDSIDESSLSIVDSTRTTRLKAAMQAAEQRFDERTWRCFWLTAIEGQTAVDVAKSTDMTAAAVRQARYRVSQYLRKNLEQF